MGILKKYIYSIAALISLSGCYRDFTGEFDATPVLCINSLITAGEPIEVSVTHTWAYPDESYDYPDYQIINKVSDAKVEIYANDILQTEDYIPQEGDKIRIVASSAKYGKAEGEVIVPVSVPIESLDWNATTLEKGPRSLEFKLTAKVTIKDSENIDNFYHISCYAVNDSWATDSDDEILYSPNPFTSLSLGSLHYQSEPIFSEHVGLTDALSGVNAHGYTFFTDRQFSGDSYTLNMVFKKAEFKLGSYPGKDADYDWNVCFTLCTISKSLYNLANYEWQSYDGSIADIVDFGLGMPVWGYSNVSTGAGVIAAQSKQTYKISLKEYLLSQMEQ